MSAEDSAAADRMVRLQLERRDITDRRVLAAMRAVPRSLFVPAGARRDAWEDHPIPIGHGQTISQPFMVAFMIEALNLQGMERVLEIGTGSGYQTALLSELCREVCTVERIGELAVAAARTLRQLGIRNVSLRTGDGSGGWPERGPFDGIIVAAAAPAVSDALRAQLADNGRLVVPVGDWRKSQDLLIVRRLGMSFDERRSIGCRFVPLIGREGFPEVGR